MVSSVLGIGETIRKMTSLPAEICGFSRRGRLQKGCFADMTVIDPERFCDRADFEAPHRRADGVKMVFVNGTLAWDGGSVVNRAGSAVQVCRDQQLFS